MVHSHSDFHISGAYMSCWSPLSDSGSAAEEWGARALAERLGPAVSSSSSHAPFDWRVSSCLSGLGPDVNCGHERGRVVVSPRAAEVALAAA